VHHRATAELDRVGVAEQRGAGEQAARPPVAEDHRREADVATATGLAVAVDVGRDEGQEAATEPGEPAGDEDRQELVAQHVDAQRLGRHRRLADRSQPQPERGAPQHPPRADEQQHRDDGQDRQVGAQGTQHGGQVADEEPVLLLDIQQTVRDTGQREAGQLLDRRRLRRATPGQPGEEPSGIALDAAHHRVFSTCHNKMMTMLDTQSGKLVGTAPIGTGVDGAAFDDSTQLVFASCGEGVTNILKEETPEKLSVVQTLQTKRSARTMALDPQTHRIYLPAADFQPAASPSPGASPARPTMIANTMKLLVYGPAK